MTWLAWRQLRLQFFVVVAALGLLAVLLGLTGPGLLNSFHADARGFLRQLNGGQLGPLLYVVGVAVLYVVPPVLGAFWGAPLVARELEAGTFRLVWTQSVSRNRWLAGRLGMVLVAAVALTGVLSLALTWWSGPIDDAVAAGDESGPFVLPRIHPLIFGARGVVPIGYAAVAVTLGVLLGLVLRRTVAALALTMVLMVGLQLAVPLFIREHLVPARVDLLPLTTQNVVGNMIMGGGSAERMQLVVAPPDPAAWITSNETVDGRGDFPLSMPSWAGDCAPPVQGQVTQAGEAKRKACLDRLSAEGYRQRVVQHPAGDFWTIQWRETGVLVLLAALLGAASFGRLRRDPN